MRSRIGKVTQAVQKTQPSNSKQKTRSSRKNTKGSSLSPNMKKANQKVKGTDRGKKVGRKGRKSDLTEASFCEDGKIVSMTVRSSLLSEFVDQFAEEEDERNRKRGEGNADQQTASESSSSEESENETSDSEDSREDSGGKGPSSINNNATRGSYSSQSSEEEQLDYNDDVLPCQTSEGEISNSDEEDSVARRSAELLKLLKEKKREEKQKRKKGKKIARSEDQAWALVQKLCSSKGYEIIRPTEKPKPEKTPGRKVSDRPIRSETSPERRKQSQEPSKNKKLLSTDHSMSEETIYQRALPMFEGSQSSGETNSNKRFSYPTKVKFMHSSSSEDFVNTSDELDKVVDVELPQQFLAECRMDDVNTHGGAQPEVPRFEPQAQLFDDRCDRQPREEKTAQRIRETEAAKAALYKLPGESSFQSPIYNFDLSRDYLHSAMVDEDYLLVAAHVDEGTQRKIANQEYVDFAKLVPRDRVLSEEDSRLELVNRGGHTYFVPAATSTEMTTISNFSRWEQSFRVFATIYTNYYPARASELIQYNHLIHTASLSFSWENVYAYDQDFRIHMSRHPKRSWGIILQQAWSVRLKDRLMNSGQGSRNSNGSNNHSGQQGKNKRDTCYRFNHGKCSYGQNCKFEHKCLICNNFGHGAWNCR